MKKINYLYLAIAISLFFSLISFGARAMPRGRQGMPTQPAAEQQTRPLASPNPALVGLNGLRLAINGIPPTLATLLPSIEQKMVNANQELALILRRGYNVELTTVPTITININRLTLTPDRPPVFSVHTILTANVPIQGFGVTTTQLLDIVVWARAETVQAASLNTEIDAVTALVNKHVDEFIKDFIAAHSPPGKAPEPNVTPPTEEPAMEEPNAAQPAAQVEYPFVASKSQLPFHKITCPLAKNILTRNRIFFKTIEEAVTAGKRPCQTCKPDAKP